MPGKKTLFSISFIAILLTLTAMPFHEWSAAFAQCGATNESVEKLMASDGAKDAKFGTSISLSGEYAIIGSPTYLDTDDFELYPGSAYIYKWNESSVSWESESGKLSASDGEDQDDFGASVSISGDYAIIGARSHNAGGIDEAGAAYVFKRVGGNWTEQAKLTADDGAKEDEFGQAVAVSGYYAVVGAYQAGAAYVFKREGDDSWTQEAKLTVEDLSENDAFSKSAVSIFSSEANVFVLVGAAKRYNRIGAAYTFKRNDDGTWSDANELTLTGDLSSGDDFGHSVSISENYAIVGAPHDNIKIDNDTQDDAGAAYIFKRAAGDVWSRDAKLTAGLNVKANDEFGYSVAISDAGYAVVGARGDADSGANNAGAVYVFAYHKPEPDNSYSQRKWWIQVDKITEAQGELNDHLGNAAAISEDGGRGIAGAYFDNEKAEKAGAAFAFEICETGPEAPTFDPGEGTYTGLIVDVTPQTPSDAENCFYKTQSQLRYDPHYNPAYDSDSVPYDPHGTEIITVTGTYIGDRTILTMVCYDAQSNRGETGVATYSFYPLAAPTFSPPGGNYTKAQQVTPTLPEEAAESYYTLNGDDPDNTSIPYAVDGSDGPITVDGGHGETVTLKMAAYNNSGDKGEIGKAEYAFDKSLAGPSFDPEGGTYPSAREVTIQPANEAFETWYTTDGSEPEKDGATSFLYETPIIVQGADEETVTVKAVSYTESGDKGRVSSASYTFEASAVVIEFDPPAGAYGEDQSVTLTLPPDASEAYYTTNGDEPDKATSVGELYDATPIAISGVHGDAITLKVAAYDANGHETARADAEYAFDMRLDAPTFSPGAGTYKVAQEVTPTIPTNAVNTYYELTSDGVEPDEASTSYDGGTIPVDAAHGETIILKMVSYDANGLKGKIGTAEYAFDKILDAPTFSPDGGTFDAPVDVSVELDPNADPNKTYYTMGTDGAEPDDNSEIYQGGDVAVDGNHGETIVFKMVSYNDQGLKGDVGTAEYTFDKTLDEPTFSPFGDVYGASVEVVAGLDSDADKTYYTLNGTDPDENSQSYDGGTILIDGDHNATITLKMVSYDAQQNKGLVGTADYTFDKEGPAKPSFDPNGGTFSAAQQVLPKPVGDASETYYTEDGSDPDKDNGTRYYSGYLSIDGAGGETITLKMVSYDALGNKGETASAEFTFEKMPGDIDGNKDVDLHDALIGLKIVAGLDLGGQTVEMGADVNGDEKIGIEEVVFILVKVSGI